MICADHQGVHAEHGGHWQHETWWTSVSAGWWSRWAGALDQGRAPITVTRASFWWLLKIACSCAPPSCWVLAPTAGTGPVRICCQPQLPLRASPPPPGLEGQSGQQPQHAPTDGTGLTRTHCWHWSQSLCLGSSYEGGGSHQRMEALAVWGAQWGCG